jgi:hypothetical protein
MTSATVSPREQASAPFAEDPSTAPTPVSVDSRELFYHLVNIEEHPELLPLAYDVVAARLGADATALPADVSAAVEYLTSVRARFDRPWRQSTPDLTKRQTLHYFLQFMPTALVDGCWLQCGPRVATAHTPFGATLTGLYAHQVRAFIEDPGRHFVADYRAAYSRLGMPLEEISSRTFSQRTDFRDSSFALPIFLMSIAQFTRSFSAEILGVNLAWQFLNLSAFGPSLVQELCEVYELPPLAEASNDHEHFEKTRSLARSAVTVFLDGHTGDARDAAWAGVVRGIGAVLALWSAWFEQTQAAVPHGVPDPRQEMLDMLWRKAPHATGYHAEKALGGRKIDDHLNPATFDGPALLDELAKSPWVKAGRSERSGLIRHLTKFGGPMMAVFSPVELQIIQRWLDSLPPRNTDATAESPALERPALSERAAPTGPTMPTPVMVSGRAWTPTVFRQRSDRLLGNCTTRELFYYLVNVERHPEILPLAEKFARDRLARSKAMLWKGERPIPSDRFDPAALEAWVYKKHRDQVNQYRPPGVRPEADRQAFIEASVQLAPIVLIDGGWLQGVCSPALIHTVIGRMLFHVLVEEIGEGRAEEHHANVYRDLLAAMGEAAPQVDTWEFARWSRLRDSSFDVPTLWLAISCFPRHFLPEIVGLNLAVELAGIGGPYMEARDTLKRFGYPTLFVDVHNAADNVAAGHSAWAMNTIRRLMDEVSEREGPHSLDDMWHRVWSGVRATLPQISRTRLMVHRFSRRVFGQDPSLVPLIFPS